MIYGLSSILSKLISVFLIPLYTQVLTPEDYGKYNLIAITFSLITMLSVFSLNSAASRWFYDQEDEVEQKKVFASWFWFQQVLTLFFFIALIVLSNTLDQKFYEVGDYTFAIATCSFLFGVIPLIIVNWFRIRRKPKQALAYSLGSSMLTTGLTVLFVLHYHMGIKGIFLALGVANFCMTLVGLILMRSWHSLIYFEKYCLLSMLKYAAPLVP